MNPLVSIIIPFYKGEQFIAEALDSVFQQNYPNIEIIIVNDGSPSETLVSLEVYRNKITFISQENKGQAAARNKGILSAHGSVIGFIDQDDAWPTNRLTTTLKALEGYDFVRGKTIAFELLADGKKASSEPTLLPVLLGAGLYRKELFDRIGLFNETMREGDDFDWNVRLNESGLLGNHIDDVTLLYRKHGNNHSITATDFVKKGIFATLKNKLDRSKTNPS